MSVTDTYSYTLQSCDSGSYPDIVNVCTYVSPSPFSGQIVYIDGSPSAETYLVVSNGVNSTLCNGPMPTLKTTSLKTCGDAIADRMYEVLNCSDPSEIRNVLLPSTYALGTVLLFTGECVCYKVSKNISFYDESLTVDVSFASCRSCLEYTTSILCDYGQRTISYAVGVQFPKEEPQDRGFDECCYSNIVLGHLTDSDSYYNDFTTVFFKQPTPNDTVTFQLVGASTGTTVLVDGTHGVEYPLGSAAQPDLSYFKVEWRKILSVLGEDVYTIRKVATFGGVAINVDSIVTYDLRHFNVDIADNTVRLDWTMDGKLTALDANFKNTGYENSVRLRGFFGDRKSVIEQNNLLYNSKDGQNYYQGQINMALSYEYAFQAYNVPECALRVLYAEGIFANNFYANDYNKNNHSYLYDRFPVILNDDNGLEYPIFGRGANVSLTFSDRSKNNRKFNY